MALPSPPPESPAAAGAEVEGVEKAKGVDAFSAGCGVPNVGVVSFFSCEAPSVDDG